MRRRRGEKEEGEARRRKNNKRRRKWRRGRSKRRRGRGFPTLTSVHVGSGLLTAGHARQLCLIRYIPRRVVWRCEQD